MSLDSDVIQESSLWWGGGNGDSAATWLPVGLGMFCNWVCSRATRDNAETDPIRLLEESMKASRFLSQCSAAVRQGLVGAFVVGALVVSLVLSIVGAFVVGAGVVGAGVVVGGAVVNWLLIRSKSGPQYVAI